ncbi:MAG: MarR family transcriptional regulator [Clostridia bacterium]|jgi:DNA-binding MarR family transcriptional regulator|nr:MarR family transcriptional regulator [Clostridia bacterium]
MDEYDVLKLENQLCFPLYAASREIIKFYKPLLDPLGLTYTQYLVMLVLWQRRKMNVKELGDTLFLDSGTLTPLLKKLESMSLITRTRSEEDERVLIVETTVKGRRLRDKALDIPAEVSALTGLSQDESLSLYALLYKLLGSAKAE